MRLYANAKINIGLSVKGRRADGYHDLETFFHKIGLCDVIDIEFTPAKEVSVTIEGNGAYVGDGMDLMEKALRVFSRYSGLMFSSFIRIEKNIPFQAGLGGGSSDAAAVLLAANSYFSNPFTTGGLSSLSLEIGSDVPFFISGFDAAKAYGRGEVLFPEPALDHGIDIYIPSVRVSTGRAFGALDSMERVESMLPTHLCPDLDIGLFPNDFELVFPRSEGIRRIASGYGFFSLSGSGSAYYGLRDGSGGCAKVTGSIENAVELYCGNEKIEKIENYLFKSN